jgi:ATP-binding protein involved in chromosome partitioning
MEACRMATVTREAILEALKQVEDPEVHRSIVEMDMVRDIEIDGDNVSLVVTLTISGCPLRSVIEQQVQEAVLALPGVRGVHVEIGTMTDEERQKFAARLRGASDTPQVPPILRPESKTRFIAVASGKGGVGKSTVTANLAVAFAHQGLRVGVVDADIYGFSLPSLFGVSDLRPAVVEDVIMPVQTHGVKLVSMQFFVPPGRPVIWRGPMLGKMLRNFFGEVHWGDLDVLLLDLPPGTGDVALDVHGMLPASAELIVTTPQETAAEVAVRAGLMAVQTKHEILGVVENMSYLACGHCGERVYPFGKGGGAAVAHALDSTLLAQVPLGAWQQGTLGIFAQDSDQARTMEELAAKLARHLAIATVSVR